MNANLAHGGAMTGGYNLQALLRPRRAIFRQNGSVYVTA
jgi:hypothetical protein